MAKLARLKMDDAQMEKLTSQLNSILEYMDQLNKADTSNAEPTAHVLGMTNVWRPDEPKPSSEETRRRILDNAPQRLDRFFKVQKVIE